TPLGSCNWGRGLGWYLLALSYTVKFTNEENNPQYAYFKNEMTILFSNLKLYQGTHYWGQFLGISKQWHIDTSVSCMLIYSLSLSGYNTKFNEYYDFL